MKRDDLHPAVRARLRRYTGEHGSHYGVVPASPEESPVRLGSHGRTVDQAMTALGRMAGTPATGIMRFLRARMMSRQEALSSSGMEGTQSTLDAVLGLDNDTDEDASARQVRSYAIALDRLVPKALEDGPDLFSVRLFEELHAHVMADAPSYRDQPGRFRDRVVWIGGRGLDIAYSTWNPPGPEHIEECLSDSARYMQGLGAHAVSQPLLLRVAIAHAHFEAVHPFLDGNGRVGRLLIPLMLAAEGHEPVYISPWIEANKSTYFEALKCAQQRLDPAPLAGAFAQGIIETEIELNATEAALQELSDIWRQSTSLRAGSSAARLLDVLPWMPILSVATASQALEVTRKAAGDGIARLCKAGILQEKTGYRRNRIFEARDVMRIVTRPFGARPAMPGEEPDDEPSPWS